MKKKYITTLSCLLLLTSNAALAMGSKKPSTPSKPVETKPPASKPVEPTPVTPPPTENITKPNKGSFGELLLESDYLASAIDIGSSVDNLQKNSQLADIRRELVNEDRVDQCRPSIVDHPHFADQISYYVNLMLGEVPARVGFIGSYYGSSTSDSAYKPVSLISNPMCNVNATNLAAIMKKVPDQKTIDMINKYVNKMNGLRTEIINGNMDAKKEYHGEWTRLFSCLGYSESLSTADNSSSKNVAASVAPSGYRKPAGVKFYNDPAQNEASRLNIGMFQFTPNASGNIQPCIRAWNDVHSDNPNCKVSQSASKAELIKVLGSSQQSFNAFCGVHKVIQTFAIQVHTTSTSATFPTNKVNSKLVAGENRCVSLHFQAGKAYNHFGPFQNSTGTNLNKLFSCIQNSR